MHRYRRLLRSSALALSVLASVGLQVRAASPPASPDPRPLPYAFTSGPGAGNPISTVDSFNGLVGLVLLHGTGTDNHGTHLEWEGDLRLMQGAYLSRDGI